MTDTELKNLQDKLWHSADMLRAGAHLAPNKYGQPKLGLIFLRYADVLFKQHKADIDEEYNRYNGSRMERCYKEISIEKCGFYLPECAYFDFINDAPDDADKAVLVKQAMEAIETENPRMAGVLPKEVYGQLVPEEVLNERPLVTAEGESLRPDRVSIRNGEVLIIAYKFGRPHPSYLDQVRSYMGTYRALGYTTVRSYLWFVPDDKVIEDLDE